MNWIDIAIIVVGVILGLIGWRMGLLKMVVLVVGLAVGIVLASRFGDQVADLLSTWIDNPGTAKIVAYIIIPVLVLMAGGIVAGIIRKILSILLLGWIDRTAGMALGVLITLAVFSFILSGAQGFDTQELCAKLESVNLMARCTDLIGDFQNTIDSSALGSFAADKFDVVLRALKLVPSGFGSPQ